MKRILGLDSLRAAAAIWVMIGHGAVPPITDGYDKSSTFAWALNGVYGGSFSGPAAVIVFFVISGLCIHYPYANGKKFELSEFLTRRYVRIFVPMIAAILVNRLFGFVSWDNPRLLAGIPAWSLVAEMIYYALYPVLLIIHRQFPWKRLFYVTFGIAFAFAFTVPISNINYPAWGYWGDWILGLPCWLLGVILAESIRKPLSIPSSSTIWKWRLGAIVLGSITRNLAFQGIIGNHLTLNFFAIYAFFWLRHEIAYYNKVDDHKPSSILEWSGKWSYSLYLIHPLAFKLFELIPLPDFGSMVNWFIKFNFILAVSIAFYFIFEKPSHLLARKAGNIKLFPNRSSLETATNRK